MPAFVPYRLATLHRETPVGESIDVAQPRTYTDQRWNDVLVGAGFTPAAGHAASNPPSRISTRSVERLWTLPDSVRPRMRMLMCGLNPSPASADAGVPFARPGNRFWPAMLAAGLATVDRDQWALLRDHRVGMTDIVKRTTRRADELERAEFDAGLGRIERLARWLQPESICFVGLAGWRAVLDRKAKAGWQDQALGGRPVYLMPSTSGLNASSQLPDLVEHLQRATSGTS